MPQVTLERTTGGCWLGGIEGSWVPDGLDVGYERRRGSGVTPELQAQ